jgi:hypothetical protein
LRNAFTDLHAPFIEPINNNIAIFPPVKPPADSPQGEKTTKIAYPGWHSILENAAMAENLKEIKINVPNDLLTEALKMFESMGLKPGDAHRDAWIEGFQAMAEKYNKVLVNKRLRRRLAQDDLASAHDDDDVEPSDKD